MYEVPVFESEEYNNIEIMKPVNETGAKLHERMISSSPFTAFPQKIWEVMFGEVHDVVGKDVLVLGKRDVAEAFTTLGADVAFVDADIHQHISIDELNGKRFDLIYAADIHNDTDMSGLYSMYKRLLKDGGLAVTLGDVQTPEMISAGGMDIFWFSESREKCPKVSFLRSS